MKDINVYCKWGSPSGDRLVKWAQLREVPVIITDQSDGDPICCITLSIRDAVGYMLLRDWLLSVRSRAGFEPFIAIETPDKVTT